MAIIEDGQGSSRLAGVNENNELKVHATGNSLQDVSASDGRGYVTYLKRNLAAGAGSNETLGRIQYNGNDLLLVSQVIISTDESSGSSKFEMFFDSTGVSGGTEVDAINLNRGANIDSETTILSGATTITETVDDALEFANCRLSLNSVSTFTYNFAGGLVLTSGKSFSLQCTSTTVGAKVRAQIWYFEGTGE